MILVVELRWRLGLGERIAEFVIVLQIVSSEFEFLGDFFFSASLNLNHMKFSHFSIALSVKRERGKKSRESPSGNITCVLLIFLLIIGSFPIPDINSNLQNLEPIIIKPEHENFLQIS